MDARPEFRYRVGERLRQLRADRHLSQAALARRMPGTTEASQISRWERGASFPNYENLVALAVALGVSEEMLVCGCEPLARARRRRG
jgi:transcriptional regulator with XRE-family HTH domain